MHYYLSTIINQSIKEKYTFKKKDLVNEESQSVYILTFTSYNNSDQKQVGITQYI